MPNVAPDEYKAADERAVIVGDVCHDVVTLAARLQFAERSEIFNSYPTDTILIDSTR